METTLEVICCFAFVLTFAKLPNFITRRNRRCSYFGLFLVILFIYALTEFRYHFDRVQKRNPDGTRTASFTFSTSFDLSLSMFDKRPETVADKDKSVGEPKKGAVSGGPKEPVVNVEDEFEEDEDEVEPRAKAVSGSKEGADDAKKDAASSNKKIEEPEPPKAAVSNLSPLAQRLGLSPDRPKRRLTILLHTGAAYYNTRLKAQLDTWLHVDSLPKGVDFLIYTTDEVQPGKEHMMFRVNNTKKFSKEVEDYISMNERVLQSFEHALRMRDSDFYIKIDDDTYVNTTLLTTLLEELDVQNLPKVLDNNPDDNINMYNARVAKQIEKVAKYEQPVQKPGEGRYYGDCSCITHTMKIPIKPVPDIDLTGMSADQIATRTLKLGRWKYACGGPGYLIDRTAMEKLVAFESEHSCHRILEDITVGLCMDYVGIGCVHLDSFINYERMGSKKQRAMFHIKPQKFLSLLKRSATIHKVLPENMYRCVLERAVAGVVSWFHADGGLSLGNRIHQILLSG